MTEIAGIENPAVELLLALELSDMPELPCESVHHGTDTTSHDDGPATHYVEMLHDCTQFKTGDVYAACAKLSRKLLWLQALEEFWFECGNCTQVFGSMDRVIRVLGPVK